MKFLRNIFGSVITVLGAVLFQIGVLTMSPDMREIFVDKFIKNMEKALE